MAHPWGDACTTVTSDGVALGGESQTLPGALRIVEIDPLRDPRWDAFVRSRPDRLVFHHAAWLDVLQRGYRRAPACLACQGQKGELLGVLPLCEAPGLLSGRRLVSLPHTPIAGPLSSGGAVTTALLEAAVDRAAATGASLQVKAGRAELAGLPAGLVGEAWSTTYVRELPGPGEQLRFGASRNHARLKWAMNKALREGVTAREASSEDDLRAWYRIYLATMRYHAVPPRPLAFFEALWTSLRPDGLMRLLLAERREAAGTRLIAGSIFLTAGATVFYAFNGCRRSDFDLRPNYLIQWRALEDACEAGYRWYDFGEADPGQEGLATFKRKWGTRACALHRYYFPAGRELERGILREGGKARQLAGAAWRRLPLGATARLGEWIYRYL